MQVKVSKKNPGYANSTLILRYLAHCSFKKKLTARTCSEKKYILRSLARFILIEQGCSLLEVRLPFIQSYIQGRQIEGARWGTVNKDVTTIKQFYAFLNDALYIRHNPSVGLYFFRKLETEPSILSRGEIDQIFYELDSPTSRFNLRDSTMSKVFYYTGITTSELSELRICDINLEENSIRISSGLKKRWRFLNLPSPLKMQIIKYFNNWPYERFSPSTRLFPGRDGQRMNRSHIYERMSFILNLTKARQKGANTFRNSFAYHSIFNGLDEVALKKMLGQERLPLGSILQLGNRKRILNRHF